MYALWASLACLCSSVSSVFSPPAAAGCKGVALARTGDAVFVGAAGARAGAAAEALAAVFVGVAVTGVGAAAWATVLAEPAVAGSPAGDAGDECCTAGAFIPNSRCMPCVVTKPNSILLASGSALFAVFGPSFGTGVAAGTCF